MQDNCFPTLCWFLPHISINQPQIYLCLLLCYAILDCVMDVLNITWHGFIYFTVLNLLYFFLPIVLRYNWCIAQYKGFPGGASGKEPACQCRRCLRWGFDPWVRKIPWRRKWQSTLVFLPSEPHGQGRPAGYSLWGHKGVRHNWVYTHTLSLSLPGIQWWIVDIHSRTILRMSLAQLLYFSGEKSET